MSIAIEVMVILIENLFFYIGIVNCKPLRGKLKNLLLLLGIMAIAVLSNPLILNTFRYIISFALFQCLIVLIYKKSAHVYDIFMVSFYMMLKFVIEYAIFGIVMNGQVNIYLICIVFLLMDIFQLSLFRIQRKTYNLMASVWNDKNKFYYRYVLLIMMNALVLFIIHSIIKIKEVM